MAGATDYPAAADTYKLPDDISTLYPDIDPALKAYLNTLRDAVLALEAKVGYESTATTPTEGQVQSGGATAGEASWGDNLALAGLLTALGAGVHSVGVAAGTDVVFRIIDADDPTLVLYEASTARWGFANGKTGGSFNNMLCIDNGSDPSADPLIAVDTTGRMIFNQGGTVTQGTSKATGVTLSTISGQITMHNAALNDDTVVSFTLTNTAIGAQDVVLVCHGSAGTAAAYQVSVDSVAAGSCKINVRNISGGALGEAIVLHFAVIGGSAS